MKMKFKASKIIKIAVFDLLNFIKIKIRASKTVEITIFDLLKVTRLISRKI